MAKRPSEFEVRRLDQLRALSSPVRGAIVDRLSRIGPASIASVARALGRKPQSLYPHFAKLKAVGLVRVVGERATARRPEKLYDTLGGHCIVVHDARDSRKRRALADGIAAGLRRLERRLQEALMSEDATTRGRARDTLWYQRSAWVTPRELAEINAHLDAAAKLMKRAEPAPGTSHQAVVFGMLPGPSNDEAEV